jgi:hypothetical protein
MNLESILDELRSQRTRIDLAIAALQGTANNRGPARNGRMKRRQMSAAARARIGTAKKAWWAKQKRKPGAGRKPTLIHSAKRKPMSPAARKKLSALMRARWAASKKAA